MHHRQALRWWETAISSGTAGNLSTDAHLAALAISHGAVLVSFNNDLARFDGLRWESPLG